MKGNSWYYKKDILTDTSTQYVTRVFGKNLLTVMIDTQIMWFRAFGDRGLLFKHISKGLDFSQRIGKTKYCTIFNYNIEVLR